jgi:catechol 2,3-dioxygenase-like lactoylglutathione lyase family enzyme
LAYPSGTPPSTPALKGHSWTLAQRVWLAPDVLCRGDLGCPRPREEAAGSAHSRNHTRRARPRSRPSSVPATVASAWCSTTSASPSRTLPRPSGSTAPSSPCWGSSPATRTPSSSSGRTWAIGPTDREHPVTRGLHVGFRAPSRAAVDAFWHAGIDAGYRDDGAPGPRTEYGPDYYGGFLLDPDGNSAEAVHGERARPVPDGRVDHLWIRVADLAASKRFYTTIAPHAGIRLGDDEPGRVQVHGRGLQLLADRRRAAAHGARPPSVPRPRGRHGARVPRRRARRRLRGPRRSRGARRVPPRLRRRVRPGPRRAQRRSRQPQPLSDDRRRRPPHLARALPSRERRVTVLTPTLGPSASPASSDIPASWTTQAYGARVLHDQAGLTRPQISHVRSLHEWPR